MCRSWTPLTPGMASIAWSTSPNSTPSGVPSMSTFTVFLTITTASRAIQSETRIDTMASA